MKNIHTNSISQLKGFYYTALFKSVSKAANYLSISQPAISIQIKQLESYLNKSILYRHKQEMRCTPEGEKLLKKVETIINSFDSLFDENKEEETEKEKNT